ncbi:RNA polymerase sigma factor [Bordetella bronchiseptica]|uniref:RNA polymerase sigma factor n=1 Tax=Bordetella bronchiseptica TaxID=518 RepID=UPI00403C85E8
MVSPPSSGLPASLEKPDNAYPDIANERSDQQLLSSLVAEHAGRLQRFIAKHIGHSSDVEDLAQQAFAEAARAYQSFRGDSQLSTWLYGIALNLVRNHLSRAPERRYEFTSDASLGVMPCSAPNPEAVTEQRQRMRLLREALEQLPESMRDVILMVGVEELSYEEAAALLSVPVGTIRSRLSRARCALREALRERGYDSVP